MQAELLCGVAESFLKEVIHMSVISCFLIQNLDVMAGLKLNQCPMK